MARTYDHVQYGAYRCSEGKLHIGTIPKTHGIFCLLCNAVERTDDPPLRLFCEKNEGDWICGVCDFTWPGDQPKVCPNCGNEG